MPYYLVKGRNGVIIQENYGKALCCQKYIQRSSMKKFTYFEDAEQAAFDHLHEIVPYYIPFPDHIEVDQMIIKSKLEKAYKEGHM